MNLGLENLLIVRECGEEGWDSVDDIGCSMSLQLILQQIKLREKRNVRRSFTFLFLDCKIVMTHDCTGNVREPKNHNPTETIKLAGLVKVLKKECGPVASTMKQNECCERHTDARSGGQGRT